MHPEFFYLSQSLNLIKMGLFHKLSYLSFVMRNLLQVITLAELLFSNTIKNAYQQFIIKNNKTMYNIPTTICLTDILSYS